MELRQFWQIIRRRWWLIVIPALVAGVLAVVGWVRSPATAPSYQVTMRFTAGSTEAADEAIYSWLVSEYIAGGLSDWVRSSDYTEQVTLLLEEDVPPAALQEAIAADYDGTTMVVSIVWDDAEQLQRIADIAALVVREGSVTTFPQMQDVEIVMLQEPVVMEVPPPLLERLDPLLRVGLGLAAGLGLAFLVEYVDPSIHERREVEDLGLDVLAEIPRH